MDDERRYKEYEEILFEENNDSDGNGDGIFLPKRGNGKGRR